MLVAADILRERCGVTQSLQPRSQRLKNSQGKRRDCSLARNAIQRRVVRLGESGSERSCWRMFHLFSKS